MREKDFRDDQRARRCTGTVAPCNRFVDKLGTRDEGGHPPYIRPLYRGVDALALSISRDPGPRAGGSSRSSGLVSVENDDQTAERMGQFLAGVGID